MPHGIHENQIREFRHRSRSVCIASLKRFVDSRSAMPWATFFMSYGEYGSLFVVAKSDLTREPSSGTR
jgi:hypothetical protein